MMMFEPVLLCATFLCSIVAGFLFAYAVVIMPGIARLDDRGFLRAFQVTDRVIQDNQPLFVLAWLGSIIAIAAAAVLALGRLSGFDLWLMELAALSWIFGVQAPTFAINLPLNRRLQSLAINGMDDAQARAERERFEPRWNGANRVRTIIAAGVTLALLVVLSRLNG